jgi:hypothetical protein
MNMLNIPLLPGTNRQDLEGIAKDFLDELVWMAQVLKWGRENVPSKYHSSKQ